MCRDLDQQPVWPCCERAADLNEDVGGARLLGEDVRLVDEGVGGLGPGDGVRVGRLDLHRGLGVPVRDQPDVLLAVEQLGEFRIRLDDAPGLLVGDVRDLLRRRDQ